MQIQLACPTSSTLNTQVGCHVYLLLSSCYDVFRCAFTGALVSRTCVLCPLSSDSVGFLLYCVCSTHSRPAHIRAPHCCLANSKQSAAPAAADRHAACSRAGCRPQPFAGTDRAPTTAPSIHSWYAQHIPHYAANCTPSHAAFTIHDSSKPLHAPSDAVRPPRLSRRAAHQSHGARCRVPRHAAPTSLGGTRRNARRLPWCATWLAGYAPSGAGVGLGLALALAGLLRDGCSSRASDGACSSSSSGGSGPGQSKEAAGGGGGG